MQEAKTHTASINARLSRFICPSTSRLTNGCLVDFIRLGIGMEKKKSPAEADGVDSPDAVFFLLTITECRLPIEERDDPIVDGCRWRG